MTQWKNEQIHIGKWKKRDNQRTNKMLDSTDTQGNEN